MIFQRTLLREFAHLAGAVFLPLFLIALTTRLVRLLGQAAGGKIRSDAVVAYLGFFALNALWDHADLSLRSGELLAQVGATDEALEWLAHAVFLGFSNWRFLASRDSMLAPLHGHPRFEAIVADTKRRQAEFLALHGERSGDHQVTAA